MESSWGGVGPGGVQLAPLQAINYYEGTQDPPWRLTGGLSIIKGVSYLDSSIPITSIPILFVATQDTVH